MAAGRIELVLGPMFSGKTGEAMRRLERMRVAGKRCQAISNARDIRYGTSDALRTHNGHACPARPALELMPLLPELLVDGAPVFDVMAVDEGQFFDDLVPFCEALANAGVVMIVAALSGTFERKLFPVIADLIPRADVLTHLTAICIVHGVDAPFTRRIAGDSSLVQIGGVESYVAACRACWIGNPAA